MIKVVVSVEITRGQKFRAEYVVTEERQGDNERFFADMTEKAIQRATPRVLAAMPPLYKELKDVS